MLAWAPPPVTTLVPRLPSMMFIGGYFSQLQHELIREPRIAIGVRCSRGGAGAGGFSGPGGGSGGNCGDGGGGGGGVTSGRLASAASATAQAHSSSAHCQTTPPKPSSPHTATPTPARACTSSFLVRRMGFAPPFTVGCEVVGDVKQSMRTPSLRVTSGSAILANCPEKITSSDDTSINLAPVLSRLSSQTLAGGGEDPGGNGGGATGGGSGCGVQGYWGGGEGGDDGGTRGGSEHATYVELYCPYQT
mmetsp:Transcript_40896/g.108087  ORF Transcript_40896/g.108087 Transcript_40896/m.108087 type:complete len:248 (-) Transcript_40896:43-786(-)